MGLFGLNLGFSSNKSKSSAKKDSTENVAVSGSESQNTQGTTSSSGSQQQNQTTSSTGTTQQTGSTKQTGTTAGTSTQAGSTTSLDQGFLTGAQTVLSPLLGKSFDGNANTISALASKLLNFDLTGFVNSQTAGASADIKNDSGRLIRTLESQAGGTADTNSTAFLLKDRVKRDEAATLAGIRANALQTGYGIEQGNLAAVGGALTSNQALIPALVTALKGANIAQTQQATTTEQQSQQSQNETSGLVSETGSSQTNTSQQQQEVVSQIVNSLLAQLTDTKYSETSSAKGKNTGFSASGSIGGK